VTSNVEPEEAQAILDLTAAEDGLRPAVVSARDFERPLRLSPEALDGVRSKLNKTLAVIEEKLALALRNTHPLELLELAEVNVEGLFADAKEPLATLCFRQAGQPGWLVFDPGPALSVIEVALGAAEAPAPEARELTAVERGMLAKLLQIVVVEIGASVGLQPDGFFAPQTTDELGTWRDGGAMADRRRLCVKLSFEGPGGSSELTLYLPGVDPAGPDESSNEEAPALPAHLEDVRIGVAARLGQSDIPLADLLAIEIGDVIPLQAPAGEPLVLFIEDRPSAHGVLGSKNGNLAVHVTDVGPVKEQE
jgi:flagellar motor switch protein FliM